LFFVQLRITPLNFFATKNASIELFRHDLGFAQYTYSK